MLVSLPRDAAAQSYGFRAVAVSVKFGFTGSGSGISPRSPFATVLLAGVLAAVDAGWPEEPQPARSTAAPIAAAAPAARRRGLPPDRLSCLTQPKYADQAAPPGRSRRRSGRQSL